MVSHRQDGRPSVDEGWRKGTEGSGGLWPARLPLLVRLGFLVLALFVAGAWAAYQWGGDRTGEPVLIAAPSEPIRLAPAEEGGEVPYVGLRVYADPVSPEVEAETSALAPAFRAAEEDLFVAPPAEALSPAPPPSPPLPRAAPPAPPTSAFELAADRASSGPMVQIGSFATAELAREAWRMFGARYGLGDDAGDIQVANLGERGIWYRLRVGPFVDQVAALRSCERLKSQGTDCLVVDR